MISDSDRREAWDFYWLTDITVREVAETYGLDARTIVETIGVGTMKCPACGGTIVFHSRTAYRHATNNRFRPLEWSCEHCSAIRLEAAAAQREAERAAAEQAAAEHAQRTARQIAAMLQAMKPVWRPAEPAAVAAAATPVAVENVQADVEGSPESEQKRVAAIDALMDQLGAFEKDEEHRDA